VDTGKQNSKALKSVIVSSKKNNPAKEAELQASKALIKHPAKKYSKQST